MICLVCCNQSFFNVPQCKPVGCYLFIMHACLKTSICFFDDFRNICLNDKRLVRVGAKILYKYITYVTIKLYKNDEEGVFKYRQGKTLSTAEFESLAENYTKIKRSTKGKNCDVTEKFRKSETNLKNLYARKENAKVKTMITVGLCNFL